ncbi:Uncharacterized protein conserved in bacteria [Serratia rubidaea]|uniref:Uncharacterized protein conserved in bacteria n=1 Tax=Serratia rubidaea TaxID=61652 RepID=A0A447QVM3_SERRU|nr:Uncharacterized protein conserved in bacteria [Serratia rubidaea]
MNPLSTIAELQDLALDLPRFEQTLTQFAQTLQLDLSQFAADHISVRCHQNATAERWLSGFKQCAEVMSDAVINGRPIYLFDLHQPLQLGRGGLTALNCRFPATSVTRMKGGSMLNW